MGCAWRRSPPTSPATATRALELLGVNAYDIAVLDRDVPGPSGDEIARRIIASGSGMPILMLTAADRLDDKASGFELGADDYLTKPFAMQELVLRLRALDRRRGHSRPPVREIAGLRLDPFRREVYREGRYVALTRKQFAVLEVLVEAEGGVISAEELLARAWDEHADPFTNAVRITVSALRKRLGEPWLIATVPGAGYRIETGQTPRPGEGSVARAPGMSVRLKLTLSYAGFLVFAAALMLAAILGLPVGAGRQSTRSAALFPTACAIPGCGLPPCWRCCWCSACLAAGCWRAACSRPWLASRTPRAWPRSGSLSHRIELEGRQDEFREFADSFDTMLARLEAHVAEQRRFAANASHELRTPLATTQALLEVARNDPQRDTGELIDRLYAVNARAIDLTEALLLLSRADQRAFTREQVDLSLIAEEATETLLPLAEQRGVDHRNHRRCHPHQRLARAPAPALHEPRAQRHRAQPASAGGCVGHDRAQPTRCRAHRREHWQAAHATPGLDPHRTVPARQRAHRAATMRASAWAWPSSRASPRRTTAFSPSRPGRVAGCA